MTRWCAIALILAAVLGVPRTMLAQGRGGQHGGGRTAIGQAVGRPANPAPARHPVGGFRVLGGLPPPVMPISPLQRAPAALGFFGRSRLPFPFFGGIGFCSVHDTLFWRAAFPGVVTGQFDAFGAVPPALPSALPVGGLQLAVDPRRADVYVDGTYAGIVDDFSGYYHHLDLPAGPHRIVILTHGYEPLIIDVLISPGRTTTYRGTLTYSPAGF